MRTLVITIAALVLSTSTLVAQTKTTGVREIKKKDAPKTVISEKETPKLAPPVIAPPVGVGSAPSTQVVSYESGISFNEEVHDYGTIEQGANGTTDFVFFNKGTEPFIIESAKGSCGCTVPVPPKEPIAPGKSSSIKVTYDTKRIGAINKNVTVIVQSVNDPAKKQTKILRITGNIKPKPQTPEIEKPMEGPVNK